MSGMSDDLIHKENNKSINVFKYYLKVQGYNDNQHMKKSVPLNRNAKYLVDYYTVKLL